ncbi:hypothetical protein [Pseudoalteromonas sp. G4]|uniref:hypothetical protein n=1 Tax=Pseudoalteromonas sp. G4 TaxID=2992761 RepID=UPI00237EDFD5|nr:hypothetical protein [Pseudoalteromonas sp. G4]MDE3273603.1 hypothetical protein [Pseudoalteromonas sp. G4]
MYSEWKFQLAQHEVRITNNWFTGLKLYVDGQLKGKNRLPIALGTHAFIKAELENLGTLEVIPFALFTVEVSVKLTTDAESLLVYSSHERVSLSTKRYINQLNS